jgi:pyrimidine operon attenuation protein/uracil phosphoribosyltransferase
LRELPIQGDYVGKVIPTSRREHIDVVLAAQRSDADAVTVFDEDRGTP